MVAFLVSRFLLKNTFPSFTGNSEILFLLLTILDRIISFTAVSRSLFVKILISLGEQKSGAIGVLLIALVGPDELHRVHLFCSSRDSTNIRKTRKNYWAGQKEERIHRDRFYTVLQF